MPDGDPSSMDDWNESDGGAPADEGPETDEHQGTDAWADDGEGQRKNVLMAQIALVVLVVIVVAVVLIVHSNKSSKTTAGTTTTAPAGIGTDNKGASGKAFPASVAGRPKDLGQTHQTAPSVKLKATTKPGIYVWSGYDGWHMWVVKGLGVPATITGTLTSDSKGTAASPALKATLATPGSGTVGRPGQSISFALNTTAPITGIDFNTNFFTTRLVFIINGPGGAPIDAKLLHTGSKALPASYPLIIAKG